MKNKNSGFTLVELVICMLIFAIVVAAAFGFMLTGSKTYGSVTTRLNLQIQSQLVINQLENRVIDCNAGICFKDDTLYILNKETDGSYSADIFQYKADGCIYYGKTVAGITDPGKYSCDVSADDLVSDKVTSFNVALQNDGFTDYSAKITIGLTKGSVSSSYSKVVALRNKPAIVTVN